jgi:4-amino-4-deoxy-L-arabinose transferase-like glycosyltransferase
MSAYPVSATAVGILALLIAPTAWAAYTVWQGGGGMMNAAGPQTTQASSWWGGRSGNRDTADPALLDYLQANRGDAKYLVATTNSMSASPIILNTGEPVISLGGFMGRDPVLTTDRLAELVKEGAVRFFLLPDRERMMEMRSEYTSSQPSGQQGAPPGFLGRGDFLQNEATSWVQDNCEQVPQDLWQSSSTSDQGGGGPSMRGAQILYDCGAGGG